MLAPMPRSCCAAPRAGVRVLSAERSRAPRLMVVGRRQCRAAAGIEGLERPGRRLPIGGSNALGIGAARHRQRQV